MYHARLVSFALLALSSFGTQATELRGRAHGNPVRKVVNMLTSMVKKVEGEGKAEQELFDKFMCACTTDSGDLTKSIADCKNKVPELESAIEASISKKMQFEKELEAHKADKAAAESAMAEATSVRNKEAVEFKAQSAETKAEASQMAKAVAALEGGVASAFLQTRHASELKNIVAAREDMSEEDRQYMISFLSGNTEQKAPGEVIGILKTMEEEASKALADSEEAEAESTKTFDALMTAKKKETKACTHMTEEKLQRVGEIATQIEVLKNELEDTKERLTEDTKMLASLKKSCSTKEAEVQKSKALRQEELVALADTIKILNDDDALELFKKTLPGSASSFLQIQISDRSVRHRAHQALRSGRQNSVQLDFIALALRGKKVGFEGVIKEVDGLIGALGEEQEQDNKKKAYCGEEMKKADDKSKDLQRTISDTKSAISKAEEDIAALGETIEKLTAGIKKLDSSIAEMTKQRKQENTEYKELMANNGVAKEILGFAKNRLNQFYNPALYKPPPKRELSEEDRITVNMGGTLAPTPPASFVQVKSHTHSASLAEYRKAAEESAGVIKMLNMLIADLDKDTTEAKVIEKDSQADYEQMMKNGAAKRASDSKALAESEAEKADLQSSLQQLTSQKKVSKKELAATADYIMSLHSECDWLLQYFDVRKQARDSEIDSLSKAKAVLSGADFAFLQVASSSMHSQRFLGNP